LKGRVIVVASVQQIFEESQRGAIVIIVDEFDIASEGPWNPLVIWRQTHSSGIGYQPALKIEDASRKLKVMARIMLCALQESLDLGDSICWNIDKSPSSKRRILAGGSMKRRIGNIGL
jgi:hypothetical protein